MASLFFPTAMVVRRSLIEKIRIAPMITTITRRRKLLLSKNSCRYYSSSIIRNNNVAIAQQRAPQLEEPSGPMIVTDSIPGPKVLALKERMGSVQECSAVASFIDYEESFGNYFVDADGNTYLDCFGQIASLPLGYNHPDLVEALQSEEVAKLLSTRPALGILPPVDWPERLERLGNQAAPRGMTHVVTMVCGSSANENAYKQAMIRFEQKKRAKGKGHGGGASSSSSKEETEHHSPSKSVIMSFKGSFHGRTFGALSTTRSKEIHKLDVAAFDWPAAPFPRLRYPLDDEQNQKLNRREEDQCLRAAERLFKEGREKNRPVAAVVIEPVQAEGGDHHASPSFFRRLQRLTARNDAMFIVDEVQTGLGATGRMWAHEAWDLPPGREPDMVTFSKKMQLGGYFYREDGDNNNDNNTKKNPPPEQNRIFNTWMGEPIKLVQLDAIVQTIQRDDLIENTRQTGEVLLDGLHRIQEEFPRVLRNARGVGTFCAIDACDGSAARDALVASMKAQGVWVGGCGESAIRLRPALIFTPEHCDIFFRALRKACSQMV